VHVTVEFHVKAGDLKGCILVTGFHGIGATGYIAVKHLVTSLKAELIGYIETTRTPPFVSVEEGRLNLPFQLYRHGKLVFVLTEVPPHPRERIEFSRALADWAIKNSFDSAYLIGGLDSRLKEREEDRMRCAATTAFIKRWKADVALLEKGLFVIGPLATMLTHFEIMGFPAIALLPYANPARPDPLAAAVAIEYLNKVFGIEVDVDPLKRDAQKIEAEIQELMKRRRERIEPETGALYL